jgi:hypothetical protein
MNDRAEEVLWFDPWSGDWRGVYIGLGVAILFLFGNNCSNID